MGINMHHEKQTYMDYKLYYQYKHLKVYKQFKWREVDPLLVGRERNLFSAAKLQANSYRMWLEDVMSHTKNTWIFWLHEWNQLSLSNFLRDLPGTQCAWPHLCTENAKWGECTSFNNIPDTVNNDRSHSAAHQKFPVDLVDVHKWNNCLVIVEVYLMKKINNN